MSVHWVARETTPNRAISDRDLVGVPPNGPIFEMASLASSISRFSTLGVSRCSHPAHLVAVVQFLILTVSRLVCLKDDCSGCLPGGGSSDLI